MGANNAGPHKPSGGRRLIVALSHGRHYCFGRDAGRRRLQGARGQQRYRRFIHILGMGEVTAIQ